MKKNELLEQLGKMSLEDSEERFRNLAAQSPISIQIFSPKGEPILVNKAWEKLWGVTLDQIKGYNILKDKQLEENGLMPHIKKAFEGKSAQIPLIKYVPSKAVPGAKKVPFRWVKAVTYPLKNKDGSLKEVVLMHEDITERVKVEEILRTRIAQQKAVSSLGEAALSGMETKDFLDLVVKEIARVLDVELAKVLELTSDEKDLVLRAGYGLKKEYKIGEAKVDANRSTHAGYSLLHNKAIIVKDLRKETKFKGHKLLWDHKVISGLSVIIKGEDKPYGVLTAHSTSLKEFSADDVHFFQSIASVIALAIERNRSDKFLALYQERFEQAQKAGKIGVYDWDILNKKLWWSDEEAIIFGFEPGYVPDPQKAEFMKNVRPDDRKDLSEGLNKARKAHVDYYGEMRMITDEGVKWISNEGRFYYDKTNNAVRFLGINVDITDRKRVEESLVFLAEASKILASSLDYQKTLDSVAKLAVPNIADWCSIDFLKSDGQLDQAVVAHKDPEKVKWAIQLRKEYPTNMAQESGLPKVLKTGKTEFYPDISEEFLEAAIRTQRERDLIKKIGGLKAIIIVPLKNKGKVIGGITFVSTESKRPFSDIDLRIAEQLADRASLAIENATLYQDVNDERKRLQDLLSNVPGVVWESWGSPDAQNQKIDFVSNYVEKMLGYSVEEWLSTPNFWLSIVHPKDREKASEESAATFASKKEGVSRFRWITKKGKSIWVEAHSYVVTDDDGNAIGMRGVTMDVTDRVEIEKRKDEFITMASHELKTPLTSMKVFSHLLDKKLKEKENGVDTYLSKMDEQIIKLTHLVNDLLDISKIQAGKLELRKQFFSLEEFIKETVEDLKLITTDNILIKDLHNENIYADKDRLAQVLMNLISNAVKYSPPNAPIEISAVIEGDKAVISVKDRGFGISKEHQQKVFQRFYRVYDNLDRTFPGLGMGLYISNEIVKRHDGDMWLKSQEGQGSTFYFSLPAQVPN